MMNTEKMTYVKALTLVLNGETLTAEALERLEALKASLEKRSASKSTKPTKAQREAEEYMAVALETLTEAGKTMRASEVAEATGVSTQKASAALRKLVERGAVVKSEGEKHVTLFAAVTEA